MVVVTVSSTVLGVSVLRRKRPEGCESSVKEIDLGPSV